MAPLKSTQAPVDVSSDESTSSLEAIRERASRRRKTGIFDGFKICIISVKFKPQEIGELTDVCEEHGGRMEANADAADIVLTKIGTRARLERHIAWEAAVSCLSTITGQHSADIPGKQMRVVVGPEYLTDCIQQNKLLDCTPYVAVDGLVPPASVPKPSRSPKKGLGTKNSPIELSDSESFDAAALPRYCCQRQTPLVCKNSELIAQLAMIRQNRWLEGDDMKALAHSRAIASIKAFPNKIETIEEIEKLPYVGKSTLNRVSEFLGRGFIEEARHLEKNERFQVLSDFTTVYGIGPVKARAFLHQNIKTFGDLERYYRRQLMSGKDTENAQGMLNSLAAREDFRLKISRAEVEEVARIIANELEIIQPGFIHTITGGYRRGKEESNDIDIVFSHKEIGHGRGALQSLVSRLKAQGIITHTLRKNVHLVYDLLLMRFPLAATSFRTPGSMKAYTKEKALERALCVIKLPDDSPSFPYNVSGQPRKLRRLDLIFAPLETYWCAVVGWTGSIMFERDLRSWCKDKLQYKFDSSGLIRRSDLQCIPVHSERHLFQLLGLSYVPPHLRNCDY
ncbi:SubName: Full=Related to DNA polymerase Tdt-N {ECO:0000313/EMBL:CCA68683.1} [Serendipita indica DSM 11827]|nr:SubName: Full=Related to DNA polymerase Tdt-N {ECO:0000313/EMBL:CCA68683.1} [Serendipita indica DSM 11827]